MNKNLSSVVLSIILTFSVNNIAFAEEKKEETKTKVEQKTDKVKESNTSNSENMPKDKEEKVNKETNPNDKKIEDKKETEVTEVKPEEKTENKKPENKKNESDKIDNLQDKKNELEDKLKNPDKKEVKPEDKKTEDKKETEGTEVKPEQKPEDKKPIDKKPVVKKTEIKKDLVVKPSKDYLLHPGKVVITRYEVKAHDNLKLIAKKFNVSYKRLLQLNNLKTPYLVIGQKIVVDKYIEPMTNFEGIIVNIPETQLYYFQKGKLVLTYGVAVGQASSRWQTPTGDFKIAYKVKDPSWDVPISIQNEMKASGQTVITQIPPGPNNPLGRWFLSLGGGIGIHSTTSPWSIGSAASHGCIRMKPSEAEVLFKTVKKDTPVKIIYQPVKVSLDDNGNIFLEIYGDTYGRNVNVQNLAKKILKDYELDKSVDWEAFSKVIKGRKASNIIIGKRT